jgi:cytoskeletal protein CcmA (bactofilin family)
VATAIPAGSPAAPTPSPLLGELRDTGAVRRDDVRVRRYTTRGAVKVLRDLTFVEGNLQGFVSVGGTLSAERLTSDATLDIAGNVAVTGELAGRGTIVVGGDLTGGDVHVDGLLRVRGAVRLDGHLRVKGHLDVATDLSARSVRFDGSATVGGTLEATIVVGTLRRPSHLTVVRAQSVRIVRPPFPVGRRGSLRLDRIEATDVQLSGVDCEYLRADRVWLGADAHVTRVDGAVVRRRASGVVGPVAREPVPAGLSR